MQIPGFRRIWCGLRFYTGVMKKAVSALFVLLISLTSFAQPSSTPTNEKPSRLEFLAVDQIQAGMKGVAYTVFQGTQPEPMDVEIIGVLKNMNGPKSDLILVRLKGAKPEYTGVVAGMSGSPVYVGGKLVGADRKVGETVGAVGAGSGCPRRAGLRLRRRNRHAGDRRSGGVEDASADGAGSLLRREQSRDKKHQ